MDSIRLAVAIAASKQWEVHHMDVKCDFLNGDIAKEIYMQKPEGFVSNPYFVCRLKKLIIWAQASPQGLVCQDLWLSTVIEFCSMQV